jgi:hypothetical protein
MRTDFIIYTDRGNKMPVLQYHRAPKPTTTHPHWVVYRDNRPRRVCLPVDVTTVWCYATGGYVPVDGIPK